MYDVCAHTYERRPPNETLNKQYQLCSALNSTLMYDLFCYSTGEIIIKLYIGWRSLSQYFAHIRQRQYILIPLILLPTLGVMRVHVANVASISRQ